MKIAMFKHEQYGYYYAITEVKNVFWAYSTSTKEICKKLVLPMGRYYREINKYPTIKTNKIYIKHCEDALKFKEFLERYLIMQKLESRSDEGLS